MEILRLSSSELEQYMKCLKTVFQDARLLDANCTDYRMVNKEGKLGEHMYTVSRSGTETAVARTVFLEKSFRRKLSLISLNSLTMRFI